MNSSIPIARSPEVLSPADSALLVIDVQERLAPLIPGAAKLVWNVGRLIDGAKIMEVEIAATEQYPKGLGPTIGELALRLPPRIEKLSFSCGGCPETFSGWAQRGINKILLAGLETHVCVLQTALDLLSAGFRVFVSVDAVGSHFQLDHDTALRRLEVSGATLTTTESALFEWCATADTPRFKQISALVRQAPPA